MVNRPGDFSTYTLALVKLEDHGPPTGGRWRASTRAMRRGASASRRRCPTDLDCARRRSVRRRRAPRRDIDYLAKDYASFRQLILDRLAQTMPDWPETHVPDIGVMLVELLAYAGDQLSYYQDAVATEAYLGTARQRISVRRHARLVDYRDARRLQRARLVTIATDTADDARPGERLFLHGVPRRPARAACCSHRFRQGAAGS